MAFEDIDWCLRAWDAGWRVLYCPFSVLTHLESKTRGHGPGRARAGLPAAVLGALGRLAERRDVSAADGALRIVYVTQGTGVGGGHRVVFEH